MKQEKAWGIVLGIINIILIAVCVFFYLRMDRTAPTLTFQATDLTYTAGMDESRLLEGITAFDSRDGDITERIVIEKMIENEEDNVLIVFYAVCDKAGNVAKASREFGARFLPENQEEMVGEIKEAGIEAELDTAVKEAENNEIAKEQEAEEVMEPTPSEIPLPSPTGIPTPTVEPTQKPVSEPPASQFTQETPISEKATGDSEQTVSGIPVFTLKVSEIKTQAGVRPALVDVIGTLSDDKDSYETLFHNIVISKYDVNKAGSYQVTLTTEDSDGNVSPAQHLTIIVE